MASTRQCASLFAVVASLVLAGCGGGGDGGGGGDPADPTPGIPLPDVPAPGGPDPTLPPGPVATEATFVSVAGAGNAQVTIDAAGRALAVWLQQDPGTINNRVWASRYAPGGGWQTPALIEANVGASATPPRVAMDPASGKAMVAWTQLTTAGRYDVWAAAFDPATGFAAAGRIENADNQNVNPRVGVDANGNAIAVWAEAGIAGGFSIVANRYAGGAWGTPRLIEANTGAGVIDGDPRIAVSPDGDAMVVWINSGLAPVRTLWSNSYTSGGSWSTAAQLVPANGTDRFVDGHDIAVDGAGNGVLTWGQVDFLAGQPQSNVIAKRYRGTTWAAANTPVTTPVASDLRSSTRIALSPNGRAIVSWGRNDNALLAAVAAPGATAWTVGELAAASNREVTSVPEARIDDAGNAFATWAQKDTAQVREIYASQFSVGGAWSVAGVYDSGTGSSFDPVPAMNAAGTTVTVWTQLFEPDGTRVVGRFFTR